MSNLLESKKIRAVLWILGGLIVLFLAFGLGITVGYNRAGFANGFDQNYNRNFHGGPPQGPAGMVAPAMPVNIHGAVGTIIDVETSTIAVKDQQNNEQSVAVISGTVIRSGEKDITIGSLAPGDHITVIGEPNDQGQIIARFVRIFPASSSFPN
jgi:hypothetical protein